MSTAADKIDNTPMAKLVTQLVGTSPLDLANLGKAMMGIESGPGASREASMSGGSVFGSIKEALVGGGVPARAPIAQAPVISPAQEVTHDQLFTFVAQQFDGVQAPSRSTGFGGIA